MTAIKQINLLVAFLLELVMLYFYSYWAFGMGENVVMKCVLATLVPTMVIVLWLIWAAPTSKHRLKNPSRSILKLSLLLLAGVLYFVAGEHVRAIWFGSVTVVNALVAWSLGQDY